MSERYDTIVIGASLAGLATAAMLSAEERQNVLVLEKEAYIGGRLVSSRAGAIVSCSRK
jgi:prolycopene isomerase